MPQLKLPLVLIHVSQYVEHVQPKCRLRPIVVITLTKKFRKRHHLLPNRMLVRLTACRFINSFTTTPRIKKGVT